MRHIPDLNIDLGELADEPEELFALAHRVNIACGGHAGDTASMTRACKLAHNTHAHVGAHPSYEDRPGFGRTELHVAPGILRESVRRQCASLAAVARHCGVPVSHIKPHGALYHAAARDPALASALLHGCTEALGPVAVVGPPHSALSTEATTMGLRYLREGFADRHYAPDGSLTPRDHPDAVYTDPAVASRAARTLGSNDRFETLCVHGDNPNAVEVARAVRHALDALASSDGHRP